MNPRLRVCHEYRSADKQKLIEAKLVQFSATHREPARAMALESVDCCRARFSSEAEGLKKGRDG